MHTPTQEIPLQMALNAYCHGFFPMANHENPRETHWFNPTMRAVLPFENLHIGRSLRRFASKHPFTITVDQDFSGVIRGCAAPAPRRTQTWINADIIALFEGLHRAGHAHSIEIWQENRLVGGLYGLALHGAFCAESMFSLVDNASKIALLHLCAVLVAGGFRLLDCQILNAHTAQFGAYEITQAAYLERLGSALRQKASFAAGDIGQSSLIGDYLKKDLTIS